MHLIDNLPIDGLVTRVNLVNSQVDIITQILADSIGTQGTLSNRLAQSLEADGTLKTAAVDLTLHHISEHLDGSGYVRMTDAERAKLSFISDNATSLKMDVQTISTIRNFINETISLEPSDSIVWRVSGNSVFADSNFPASAGHYYGIVPANENNISPDYQNYLTSSLGTPYQEGTLRVYINGIRLNASGTVYVPFGFPGTLTWVALSYTEGTSTDGVVTDGSFSLSQAISSSASIIIDFDVLFS